ncbi:hypothetical protein [Magnetospirillum sp. 64-120]|uniref:HPr kinase/phosphorylase n=1 Tax=Magnetospirillum sp. 64-120 TaxID=1895778 RepID=UPI0009262665|nr:hypothetical protein [Magnetospirillum sp. 64-120]OJX67152.1 MAG: hypothetical protein BGO92_01055 [Magnetospirillum sp. 64-120]
MNNAVDFRLCGLRVRSDLALSDLPAWDGDGRPADLTIRLGLVPDRLTDIAAEGGLLQVAVDGHCRFAIPDVAAYLLSPDATTLTVAPAAGATVAEIQAFLFGSVFTMVSLRRGWLPLHACCVRVGGHAVAFAGASGAGKSTLAAGLMSRGFSVLADDQTVVELRPDGGPWVQPSFPRIKLWRDALDRLGQPVDGLARVRRGLEKYSLPVGAAFHDQALPLRHLYLLVRPGDGGPVTPLAALSHLPSLLSYPRLLALLLPQDRLMEQMFRLAGACGGIRLLERPETERQWQDLLDLLQAGAAAS